jgi:hypothetical protein
MLLLLIGCFEAPNLNMVPTRFDFGAVLVGESGDASLQMENIGTGVLEITEFEMPPDFRIEPETLTLAEAEVGFATVFFEPTVAGAVEDEMTIWSNDVDGEIRLSINAVGAEP